MNGEMPGTGRFTPRGSGATGWAALGNRSACWARDTFFRVASDRPPTSPIAAAAAVTPAATRNCRRAGGPAGPPPRDPAPSGPARNGSIPLAQDPLSPVPRAPGAPAADPAGAAPAAGPAGAPPSA